MPGSDAAAARPARRRCSPTTWAAIASTVSRPANTSWRPKAGPVTCLRRAIDGTASATRRRRATGVSPRPSIRRRRTESGGAADPSHAGRDASGIDIGARARLLESQELCSTPAASRPRRPTDCSAADAASGDRSQLSIPMRRDAFGCARSIPGNYRLLVGRRQAGLRQRPHGIRGSAADCCRRHRRTWSSSRSPASAWPGQVVLAEGPPLDTRDADRVPRARASRLRTVEIVATMDDDRRFYGSDVFGPHLVASPGCRWAGRSKR